MKRTQQQNTRAPSPTPTAFSGISNYRSESYRSIKENNSATSPAVPSVDARIIAHTHFNELSSYLAVYLARVPANSRSTARQKMTLLTKQKFQELSTDVYEELVRRKKNSSENEVSFPPFRDGFHPKRNQARQKLATLPTTRFEDLSSDVYYELARRYPEFNTEEEIEVPYVRELRESGGSTVVDDRELGDRGDTDDGEGRSRQGSALGGGGAAGEEQEKLRRDYEYKIATMQIKIAALERDLGGKGDKDKKRKSFNLDFKLEGTDVEDNILFRGTFPHASPALRPHGSPSTQFVGPPGISYPHNLNRSFNPFTEANEISGAQIESWVTNDIPYKNMVLLLRKRILEVGQGTNYLNTLLRVHVERMKSNSAVLNLVESSQNRTWLMELSSVLGCHDNQIRRALDEDETDIVRLLQVVLNCDTDKNAVLRLRGEDAERFLTLSHNVLDSQGFPFDESGQRSRHNAHRLLVKLSENCGILPSSLSIVGIDNCSKEPVAGGGFADIFRASYQGEDVALKRLRDFQVHQKREIIHRRFCREATLWQDLKHPNVLPFYGIDLETFLPRLSMVSPWMRHGTILKHIAEIGGPLTANVDRYLSEIAQGLNYLHSRSIIHGDLRGTNIFIDDQWHVRLADFGLAGFADATLVTNTSHNAGSIRWMAPELHNPEMFDLTELRRTAASDVYAFACVTLEIYTRDYPFSYILRDSTVILKVMHGIRPIRPTSRTGKTISDHLWYLIQLCWQQAPSDRPQMLDVVERLQNMLIT